MTSHNDSNDGSSSRVRNPGAVAAGAAGGVAAAGLALLYTYGALIKATQLHGAGLTVMDTLPLVPLQQVLLTGVSQLIRAGALILAIFTFLFLFRLSATGDELFRSPVVLRRQLREVGVLGVAIGVVMLGLAAVLQSVGGFVSLTFFLLAALILVRRAPHFPPANLAAALVLAYITFLLAINYLDPKPLPVAEIRTEEATSSKDALSPPQTARGSSKMRPVLVLSVRFQRTP
jgi:hypothetical protein